MSDDFVTDGESGLVLPGRFVASKERYLFPPRAELCVPWEGIGPYRNAGYCGQYKFNDSRCLAWLRDGSWDVELWNRHKGRLKYVVPEFMGAGLQYLASSLGFEPGKWCAFDGGLLFNKHKLIRDVLVIWDILAINGKSAFDTVYPDRYMQLFQMLAVSGPKPVFINSHGISYDENKGVLVGFELVAGLNDMPGIILPVNINYQDYDSAWDNVNNLNAAVYRDNKDIDQPILEGVVFKSLSHKLELMNTEKNNGDFMARSRVVTRRHKF